MYSSRNLKLVYDKGHTIEIIDGNAPPQQRCVNLMIIKNSDASLILKLKDANCLSFNFTSIINKNQFQLMKKEQCLSIDFDEFESHLLEMLQSNSNEDMLIKCVRELDSKCQLVFYETSKIKCLIFLVIHMVMTNYREVLEEVEVNLQSLEESNRHLTQQLSSARHSLKEKDNDIVRYTKIIKQLEQTCVREIQNINRIFLHNLGQCKLILDEKIILMTNRTDKLVSNVDDVKNEVHLKSAFIKRLQEKFENHKKQNLENISLMNMLKMDCARYKERNQDLETQIAQLRESKSDCDKRIIYLEKQVEEYRKDLENSALIINKKTQDFNELTEDMLQAGRIIKDFSKYYETKAQEVEELKEALNSKDKLIKEQIFSNNSLFKEYQEYKADFNEEKFNKMLEQVSLAENKVAALQKENRELLKINGLLSKKISSTNMLSVMRDEI